MSCIDAAGGGKSDVYYIEECGIEDATLSYASFKLVLCLYVFS